MSRRPFTDLIALRDWFQRQKRILPWREDPSPYRVWVSEIMLQQTQVVTVVPYFDRFLKAFPTVESLARSTDEDVMREWQGLGYYSRARNLRAAAQAIVAQGGFPNTRDGWESLKGVGPYTAGAILSIAFHQPEALVDGNVERVFARLFRISRSELGDTEYKKTLWGHAERLIAETARLKIDPSIVNQAWMEIGATVCVPAASQVKCGICPLSPSCSARKNEQVAVYPEKKKRLEKIQVEEQVLVVFDRKRDRVWMEKPDAQAKWRNGLWDFPKISQAPRTPDHEVQIQYVVTRHQVKRRAFVLLNAESIAKNSPSHENGEWVSASSPERPMGAPVRKLLALVQEQMNA